MTSKKGKENKKDTTESDSFDHQIGMYTYEALYHLPNQIDALNRIYLQFDYDDNNYAQSSLSHLYVISLCTFLEALVRNSYKSFIMRNYNKTNDVQLMHLIHESLIERGILSSK